MYPSLAIRVPAGNANHHLWRNHGTWFIHYTLHSDPLRKVRVRESLGTHDLVTARNRRDRLLRRLGPSGAEPGLLLVEQGTASHLDPTCERRS